MAGENERVEDRAKRLELAQADPAQNASGSRAPHDVIARERLILCALVAGFLLVAMHGLGREALWIDEMHSLRVASLDLRGMWHEYRGLAGAYLLYFVVLGKVWIPLVGATDIALREFSVVGGVVALLSVWRLTRLIATPVTALLTTGLAATSPFLIGLSQEARMYSWFVAIVALNGICFVHLARANRGRGWALCYVLSATVGLYTHLFFALSLAAQLTTMMFTTPGRTLLRRRFLLPFVVIGLSSIPLLFSAATATATTQLWKDWRNVVFGAPYAVLRFTVGYWLAPPNVDWKQNLLVLVRHDFIPLAACLVSLLLLGSMGLKYLRRSHSLNLIAPGISVASFVLANAVLPTGLLLAASPFRLVMSERYVVGTLPFFWLVIALGLEEAWRSSGKRIALAGVAALLIAVGGATGRFLTDPLVGHERWHEVAQLIADSSRAGDPVWVHRDYMMSSLNRYLVSPRTGDVVPAERAAFAAARPVSILLVLSHVEPGDTIQSTLRREYRVDWDVLFPQESGISVLRLSRRAPSPAPPAP